MTDFIQFTELPRLRQRIEELEAAVEERETVVVGMRGAYQLLRERMEDLEAAQRWVPVSEAPKDGTHIWCYTEEGDCRECWWREEEFDGPDCMGCDAGWVSACVMTWPARSTGNPDYHSKAIDPPVWFMPLPTPPEQED